MKKHAIIPIFIPHRGCPNDCIFCNQKKITARQQAVSGEDVEKTIETYLSTLEPAGTEVIETAFFGGSFTGIPMEEQSAYLSIAKRYKDAGRIHKIHMSTRPDYISEEILENLKRFDADTIELGVQSFDDQVLRLSGRGHDSSIVYRSSQMIRDYGFELGIQLMIGLPGDTPEKDIRSAREAVKCRPSIARLYPTVVIEDTELYQQYLRGEYVPMTEEDAVSRTRAMYRILSDAGIRIIRVGLKSSDIISEKGQTAGGSFHPAFRQLVEGDIAREEIEKQLQAAGIVPSQGEMISRKDRIKADFYANRRCFSNLIGNSGRNRKFFLEKYPGLNILYKVNDLLPDYRYEVKIKR
ncbi:MAG: elongator complex protein 3 [Emergencia sp.]